MQARQPDRALFRCAGKEPDVGDLDPLGTELPVDGARLVLDIPGDETARVLAVLGLGPHGATRAWVRLFEHAGIDGADPLYLRRASVLSVPDRAGATLTSIRLWRVRRRVLSAWWAADGPDAGERLRVIQEWHGQVPSLAATLTAARAPGRAGLLDPEGLQLWGSRLWARVLTPGQQRLLEAGTGIDLRAGRATPLGPVEEAGWRLRRGGVLLGVRRWRASGLNALEIACLARVAEAPFLRSAVRALAAELGLDPEITADPLDLRAAARLSGPGHGAPGGAG
jgi:hypothetical protein